MKHNKNLVFYKGVSLFQHMPGTCISKCWLVIREEEFLTAAAKQIPKCVMTHRSLFLPHT